MVRSETPVCWAIALPVQWWARRGGSAQVSASTVATVVAGTGALPGGRVLSQEPVHALFGEAPLPTPDRRPAHCAAMGDFQNRQALSRPQNDPGPLDVLLRAVSIAD